MHTTPTRRCLAALVCVAALGGGAGGQLMLVLSPSSRSSQSRFRLSIALIFSQTRQRAAAITQDSTSASVADVQAPGKSVAESSPTLFLSTLPGSFP